MTCKKKGGKQDWLVGWLVHGICCVGSREWRCSLRGSLGVVWVFGCLGGSLVGWLVRTIGFPAGGVKERQELPKVCLEALRGVDGQKGEERHDEEPSHSCWLAGQEIADHSVPEKER